MVVCVVAKLVVVVCVVVKLSVVSLTLQNPLHSARVSKMLGPSRYFRGHLTIVICLQSFISGSYVNLVAGLLKRLAESEVHPVATILKQSVKIFTKYTTDSTAHNKV